MLLCVAIDSKRRSKCDTYIWSDLCKNKGYFFKQHRNGHKINGLISYNCSFNPQLSHLPEGTMNNTVDREQDNPSNMLNTSVLQHCCYFQNHNKYRIKLQKIYVDCININSLTQTKHFKTKRWKPTCTIVK